MHFVIRLYKSNTKPLSIIIFNLPYLARFFPFSIGFLTSIALEVYFNIITTDQISEVTFNLPNFTNYMKHNVFLLKILIVEKNDQNTSANKDALPTPSEVLCMGLH